MNAFNYTELATVLAALRHFQNLMETVGIDDVVQGFEHFVDVRPLTPNEIDDLCSRLNYLGTIEG